MKKTMKQFILSIIFVLMLVVLLLIVTNSSHPFHPSLGERIILGLLVIALAVVQLNPSREQKIKRMHRKRQNPILFEKQARKRKMIIKGVVCLLGYSIMLLSLTCKKEIAIILVFLAGLAITVIPLILFIISLPDKEEPGIKTSP